MLRSAATGRNIMLQQAVWDFTYGAGVTVVGISMLAWAMRTSPLDVWIYSKVARVAALVGGFAGVWYKIGHLLTNM